MRLLCYFVPGLSDVSALLMTALLAPALQVLTEQTINKVLVSLCESNPQDASLQNEDWLIIEDPLQAHIAVSEPSLDSSLFGATVNERTL